MKRGGMDAIIRALVLIRFGQELGSGGRIASAIRDIVDALMSITF